MDRVAHLVASFRLLSGDDDAKVEIILDLEDDLTDSRALDLFAEVVADPAEYDLARIECIKILRLQPPGTAVDLHRVGRVVAAVLHPDEDYLVRQYAAGALGSHARDPVVFEALSRAVLADEDIDVRHNALASVAEAGPDDRTVALLRQLADDPELAGAAERILRQWPDP